MIGFQVYIDESGDEGFRFNDDGSGSSRWFVLSAVIIPKATDLETVKLVDRIREALGRTRQDALHFRKLQHGHRLPYIARIAEAKLRTVNVLVHKPSIPEPEEFSEKYALYRSATRFLLERVSWYCRDHRRDSEHTAKVIFSSRANMSYGALLDYLDSLKSQTGNLDVRIDWSVIKRDLITAAPHHRFMGLQIADAVASGMWYAVELSRHGFVEPRYAEMLRPTVYCSGGTALDYGVKVWPREAGQLMDQCPELDWMKRVYQ